MVHAGLQMMGSWSREDYAAGYRARFSDIPVAEEANHCWRTGWDDADTELLESTRHRQALSNGREDDFPGTWMLLFDVGGDARMNAIPFDAGRTVPWKEGWIETDINLGVSLTV